jgi:hypothetical protein
MTIQEIARGLIRSIAVCLIALIFVQSALTQDANSSNGPEFVDYDDVKNLAEAAADAAVEEELNK